MQVGSEVLEEQPFWLKPLAALSAVAAHEVQESLFPGLGPTCMSTSDLAFGGARRSHICAVTCYGSPCVAGLAGDLV